MLQEDAPLLFACFQDPETSRFWFTPDKTLDEAYARIERLADDWAKKGFSDWAVVERKTDSFIGFVGLHHISWMSEVNLGYLLARSAWGKGYGTEAARAALEFGLQTAGLKQIVGITHPDNYPSIRVLQKIGMTYWKDTENNGVPRVVYSIRPDHR
jgi:ribosomal-protein-alanine N-acetyltransferase